MVKRKKNRKKANALKKKERLVKKNGQFKKIDEAVKYPSGNKPPKNINVSRIIKIVKNVTKKEIDFIKLARNHPELQPLIKILPALEMSFEDFLNEMKLKTFLETNYNPKGTINEILVLRDPVIVNILKERALGSLKDLSLLSKDELAKAIFNIKNKSLNLKDFEVEDFKIKDTEIKEIELKYKNLREVEKKQKIREEIDKMISAKLSLQARKKKIEIATNFNTIHESKAGNEFDRLFHDFSVVKFNPKNNQLLIIIPGEIKEPSAARELADQFAQIERRLKSGEKISFEINGKRKEVNPEDVFVLKDNAVGVARRKNKIRQPRSGTNLKIESPVATIVQINSRDTRSINDKQEFFRLLVKTKKDYSPDKLTRIFNSIKNEQFKISKK